VVNAEVRIGRLRMSLNNGNALSADINMFNAVPLHGLACGDTGQVTHVLGSPQEVQRIRELGITDGARIEMVRSGTPCIIRAGMQTLCVRGNDLLRVLVQPGAGA
jgi:ferrous iron transport protein A